MATKKTTIVFSINVHENLNFLIKQLEDIKRNVLIDYVVIINANEHMYNEIKYSGLITEDTAAKLNIVVYPWYVEKIHNHGTLTMGIYLNMEYAVNNYIFEYFIVLSSRNLFYNKLHQDNYKDMPRICESVSANNLNTHEWHWHLFIQTKLAEHIIKNSLVFSKSYEFHEGLTFDYQLSQNIVGYLQGNEDIKNNLFDFNWGVEEFALHTIALNLNGYYYHIGNWTLTDDYINIDTLPKDRFVYKTYRSI
jgi:hypothetical protein